MSILFETTQTVNVQLKILQNTFPKRKKLVWYLVVAFSGGSTVDLYIFKVQNLLLVNKEENIVIILLSKYLQVC